MTIEEMKARKAELGYTNEKIAELSGVPLGTVQKIFAGETKSPRYETIQKLLKVLRMKNETYIHMPGEPPMYVAESVSVYEYETKSHGPKKNATSEYDHLLRAPKKAFGIANGKMEIPPDEMFYDDEITELFEDI